MKKIKNRITEERESQNLNVVNKILAKQKKEIIISKTAQNKTK